jgi:hypothetical protein
LPHPALSDGTLDHALLQDISASGAALQLTLQLARWCGMADSAPTGVVLQLADVRNLNDVLPPLLAAQAAGQEVCSIRHANAARPPGADLALELQIDGSAAPLMIFCRALELQTLQR